MKREDAHDLAFTIIGDFENLLSEHDIMLPSADREGLEDEACIYGSEYDVLEDGIVEVLRRQRASDLAEPRSRRLAVRIVDQFEKLLAYHCIKIPTNDPAQVTTPETLPKQERDKLIWSIVELLLRETAAVGTKGSVTARR